MLAHVLLLAAAAAESLCISPASDIILFDAGLELTPSVILPGWVMTAADGRTASSRTSLVGLEDGVADIDFRICPVAKEPTEVQQLVLRGVFGCEGYAGGRYEAGDVRGTLPSSLDKGHLFRGRTSGFAVWDASGRLRFRLAFAEPVELLLQDERHWRRNEFEFRIVFAEKFRMTKGADFGCRFRVSSAKPVVLSEKPPPTTADDRWIPLTDDALAVRAGSVLDFSRFRPDAGAAGELGRVIATNGHFAFERHPLTPVRFFGVNVCSSASVLPEDRAEAFAQMLARRGYNAVRFHHQDALMTTRAYDGTLDPAKMRRFDALVKACIDRGIYFTLDLQVTRRISWRACGIEREGLLDKYDAKRLIVTDKRVRANYVSYVRQFLSHVNPFTGRAYAQEPALIGLSLINELNPEKISADQECVFVREMRAELKELGCRALLTDLNLGLKFREDMLLARQECLDYSDTHIYVRHPQFSTADKKGGLRQSPFNPLRDRVVRLMPDAGQRLAGKPAVITEWNWPAPCRWRAASGIVTGSSAARDGWDGLWRFAWSHSDEGATAVKPLSCFDIAGDPINRLAEYATASLFLRRDGDDAKITTTSGVWCVSSRRTCAIAAERGTFHAGALDVSLDSPAAVWITGLDGRTFASSKRLVLFHLTDARMTGESFFDPRGAMLAEWGTHPALIRRGVAKLSLALGEGNWKVSALRLDGTPVGEVSCEVSGENLSFVADTAAVSGRATMAYEIVRISALAKSEKE